MFIELLYGYNRGDFLELLRLHLQPLVNHEFRNPIQKYRYSSEFRDSEILKVGHREIRYTKRTVVGLKSKF